MKILCFILSFYVFAISTVPCCTDQNCKDEEIAAPLDSGSSDNPTGCGVCSPLLTCNACCGFVFYNQTFRFELEKTINNRFISSYRHLFIEGIYSKIWQPPKMG